MRTKKIKGPGALYRQRAMDYFRFQYKAVTSVVDLTILLYIVIPGLLLFSRFYYDFWQSPLPAVLANLPLGTMVTLMLAATGLRGLIMHLEPADILFLHNRPGWMNGLKLRGLLGSAGHLAVLSCAAGAVLAPFLTRIYGMSAGDIALLCLTVVCFRSVHMLLMNYCWIKWTGFRAAVIRWVMNLAVLGLLNAVVYAGYGYPGSGYSGHPGLGHPAVMAAAAAIAGLIALLMAAFRLRTAGTFYADVNEDTRQKTRLTALLLSSSIDKPKLPRSRPLLFRRSGKLLLFKRTPEGRVAELAVKSILRSRSMLRLHALYTLIGAASLQLPPYPVNAIVFACLIALQAYWMNGQRKLFTGDRFLTLLPEDGNLQFRAAKLIMRFLLLPPITVYSVSLAWAVSGSLRALLAGLGGGLVLGWWAGSWVWKAFGGWRGKSAKTGDAALRSR